MNQKYRELVREEYTEHPHLGRPKLTAHLRGLGHSVNPKRGSNPQGNNGCWNELIPVCFFWVKSANKADDVFDGALFPAVVRSAEEREGI